MKRRDFLRNTALATGALATGGIAGPGLAPTARAAETKDGKPVVKAYRPVGKTGLKMSDISCGTGGLPSASMVLRAVDRGINYFDTAPDYGQAENYIGEAMGKIQRDKVIIASKMCTSIPYPGHLPVGTKKKDYIASVEGSLSRMKTDYLDFCFVHAMGEMNKDEEMEAKRLLDEEMLSAVEEMKKAGKIRFLATSSHGPNNMESLLTKAVRSGHYDLIMASFNFMKFPKLPDVMKEAHAKGVAVVAMKAVAGAKEMDLGLKETPFEPAALKWTLNHPELSGLVITMKTVGNLDLYLSASGEKFTAADQRVLDLYAERFGREYCRTGCGDCEDRCPSGVPIASILRYQMYFQDYGMEKKAMESYASLGTKAGACAGCEGFCSGGCPYGLAVSDLVRNSHKTLSFTA